MIDWPLRLALTILACIALGHAFAWLDRWYGRSLTRRRMMDWDRRQHVHDRLNRDWRGRA